MKIHVGHKILMVLLNLVSTLRACKRAVSSGDNKTALKVLDVFSEIEESLKIPDENSSNKITSPIKNIMPDRHIAQKKNKKKQTLYCLPRQPCISFPDSN